MDSLVCVVCVSLIWVITAFLKTATTSEGGGGEGEEEGVLVLRISSDRDDQMGTKRKRKKSLDQYLPPPPPPTKKKGQNPIPGYAETIRNLQIVLNTQKNSLCKLRYQKNTWIFLSKFQTQTILWSFPSYEIWSTPQGRCIHHLSGIRRYMLGRVRFKRKRRD